jgi:hypothetical protein
MDRPLTYTKDDEVADVRMERPHVVILGAGASRAACPRGDRSGRPLPLMADFSACLGLDGLLRSWDLTPSANFEDIYSGLHEAGRFDRTAELARIVENYFGSLQLPDEPTVYDYLIMGLRETDVIATFNWDPLILQAYQRAPRWLSKPRLAFLHGNVAIGYCDVDECTGVVGSYCSACGMQLRRMPLLYPVRNKDYAADPAIAAHWDLFRCELNEAFMVTVFGYSGPRTDAEAIAAMGSAWGNLLQRSMEQFAFITFQTEWELADAWSRFIHTHHYEVHRNFHDSWIARHPRRTGEAYIAQYLEARFIDDNSAPSTADIDALQRWHLRFSDAEAILS